jgi:FMN-dependent oxidoreductase (nitrilotriacetate monooxygenase family)
MTRDRRIRFNGFKCSTVAHTTAGLWRHPNSQSHRYKELSFWIELAKTLERGKFDSLFVADALGVLDIYRGSPDQTLREGLQTPTDDPLLAVSAMAAATQHLGFGITVASLYELPYLFARKMTTLDHLTDGRIGWNIVTSALDSAARNLGRDEQIPHDERYAVTDEFMEVVYRLWEGSWEEDAVVHDRASGTYADPAKVHAIGHEAGTIRSLEFFSASRRASARPFFIRPERRPPAGLSPGATPKASSSRDSVPTLCAGWSTVSAARRKPPDAIRAASNSLRS